MKIQALNPVAALDSSNKPDCLNSQDLLLKKNHLEVVDQSLENQKVKSQADLPFKGQTQLTKPAKKQTHQDPIRYVPDSGKKNKLIIDHEILMLNKGIRQEQGKIASQLKDDPLGMQLSEQRKIGTASRAWQNKHRTSTSSKNKYGGRRTLTSKD